MTGPVRATSVAESFYPRDPGELGRLVAGLFSAAERLPGRPGVRVAQAGATALPTGILVPHAGLVYSGVVAAAAWACMGSGPGADPGRSDGHQSPPVVVLLGTNHRAGWLDGVGAWDAGAWQTPSGAVAVDQALATEVLALGPPFVVDRDAHRGEHSLEVQLPLLRGVDPGARIVPLAVSAGVGDRAITAGERLGRLLAARRDAGERIVLAISTDMAHYPPADECARVTELLLPAILDLDAAGLAVLESDVRRAGIRGLACGMCGIQPAVMGLAALRAMGVESGTFLAAATSGDAGGPRDETVGYLAVRFDPRPVS